MGVHLPALHNQVARQQGGGHDAVEIAAQGVVVPLQPGGLLGENQVVGNGTGQGAAGNGPALVLLHQVPGLDGVIHVEAGLLHQSQQGDMGLLVLHIAQGVRHIADDVLLLGQRGAHGDGHVSDGDELGVLRHTHQIDVGDEPVGAQAVFLVQQGQKKLPRLGAAPHQQVSLSLVDQVDGPLGGVVPRLDPHQLVVPPGQAQPLQQGPDSALLPHQDGVGKTLRRGVERAQEDVFRICPGNHHPAAFACLLRLLYNLLKILHGHDDPLLSPK